MSITNLFNEGDDPRRPSRREERRADRVADAELQREDERLEREQRREDARLAAEEKRKDDAVRLQGELFKRAADEKATAKARKDKDEEKSRRKVARKAAWTKTVAAVSEHMPPAGMPVVAVSLGMGWSGQAGAAQAAGMGVWALGVPVLFEGMVLTLAGLTSAAIGRGPKSPYKFLLGATWASGVFAAAVNASGHLIEDHSAAGIYRAGAYAAASLAALVLWALVMRSKKARLSGEEAAEVARWRRLRRSHPVVAHRAQRIADLTGTQYPQAWALAWSRTKGASVDEPMISEIRTLRRSTYRRSVALAWDGRKGRDKPLDGAVGEPVPGVVTPASEVAAIVPTQAGRAAPGLWIPDLEGRFERAVMSVPDAAPGTPAQGPETQFPLGNPDADGDVPDEVAESPETGLLDLPERKLRQAAKAWHGLQKRIEKDKRLYSRKAHLGVSPYALAKALRMRRQDGAPLVRTLIDAQLIPAAVESE
ncbi:hypothetical protein [Streptomyces sp. SID3343]|uniref:hypothetical protein n=1 Tax=Streptomyces sp. SID3343 TaxID=2690260 RepID=UPI00136C0443|nr:hypothetical protein [Streptomyces sp. SID3343]MYW00050.1 hypothetical protein [Streptomyces sp. SID3343]